MTHRRVLDPSGNVTSNTRFEHAMGIEAPIEILVEGSEKSQDEKISAYARLYVEPSLPIEHIFRIEGELDSNICTYDYEPCIDELI